MIRPAEEILKENTPFGMLFEDVAVYAIKVAQREAIEASAKVAQVKVAPGNGYAWVDKQSILNLIEHIK